MRKTKKIIVAVVLLSIAACNSNKDDDPNKQNPESKKKMDTVKLTTGASLLFNGVATNLNKQEQNDVFASLGFQCTSDGERFFEKGGEDFPFGANIYPTDLNEDGREELFILYGNMYTSGNTGSSILLLLPDINGKYILNLGFPGSLPDVIQPKNATGYPDLLIGIPGRKIPIWGWNGKEYILKKSIAVDEIQKLNVVSVDQYSAAYQKKIANRN